MNPENLYLLAERAGLILLSNNSKLVTAESCTGGWVAQMITAVPGSSDWFDRGLVAYSNEAKQELLGVRASTIAKHGAVSSECVVEMVRGAWQNSKADCVLAVTGVAGPTGGSDDKPVGTVWFGWMSKNGDCKTLRQLFRGDRNAIRRQAVEQALKGIVDVCS